MVKDRTYLRCRTGVLHLLLAQEAAHSGESKTSFAPFCPDTRGLLTGRQWRAYEKRELKQQRSIWSKQRRQRRRQEIKNTEEQWRKGVRQQQRLKQGRWRLRQFLRRVGAGRQRGKKEAEFLCASREEEEEEEEKEEEEGEEEDVDEQEGGQDSNGYDVEVSDLVSPCAESSFDGDEEGEEQERGERRYLGRDGTTLEDGLQESMRRARAGRRRQGSLLAPSSKLPRAGAATARKRDAREGVEGGTRGDGGQRGRWMAVAAPDATPDGLPAAEESLSWLPKEERLYLLCGVTQRMRDWTPHPWILVRCVRCGERLPWTEAVPAAGPAENGFWARHAGACPSSVLARAADVPKTD